MSQAVQRAQPPTRSSSLRSQSSPSSVTVSTESGTADGKPAAGPSTRLAVELQRLHELKRQVSAQEQRLVALRTSTNTAATVTDSNGTVGNEEESETMKALVFAKEKELALALMKVAELTSQLDQLRAGTGPSSEETAVAVSRHSTRPASTGSIHEHRHSRVVVKPTTAPPPPPVAAAAVLSPAGDKKVEIKVVSESSKVTSGEQRGNVSSPSAPVHQRSNSSSGIEEKKKKTGRHSTTSSNTNNHNTDNTPYGKLVQTVAALARSHRRSEGGHPKRSESLRGQIISTPMWASWDPADKPPTINGKPGSRSLDGSIGDGIEDIQAKFGCFDLDMCTSKDQTLVAEMVQPVEHPVDKVDDVVLAESGGKDSPAVLASDASSVPATSNSAFPSGNTSTVLVTMDKPDDVTSSGARSSSSAQMMCCFAPKPYGVTSPTSTAAKTSGVDIVSSSSSVTAPSQTHTSASSDSSQSSSASTVVSSTVDKSRSLASSTVADSALSDSTVIRTSTSVVTAVGKTTSNSVSSVGGFGSSTLKTTATVVTAVVAPVMRSTTSGATTTSRTSGTSSATIVRGSGAIAALATMTTSNSSLAATVVTTVGMVTVAPSMKASTATVVSVVSSTVPSSSTPGKTSTSTSVSSQPSSTKSATLSAASSRMTTAAGSPSRNSSSGPSKTTVNAAGLTVGGKSTSASSTKKSAPTAAKSSAPSSTKTSTSRSPTPPTKSSPNAKALYVYTTRSAAGTQGAQVCSAVASTTSKITNTASSGASSRTSSSTTSKTVESAKPAEKSVKSSDSKTSSEVKSAAKEEPASESSVATSSSPAVQSSSLLERVSVGTEILSTTTSLATTTPATTSVPASQEPTTAESTQSSLSKELVSSSSIADDEVDGGFESLSEAANGKSVDISTDSVSSALSVLLKSTPTSSTSAAFPGDADLPSSPKSAYRYACRSAAMPGLYRRKLGASSLDQYSRNIDQLYGSGSEDFFSSKLQSSDNDMSPSISSTGSPSDARPFSSLVSPSPSSPSPDLSSPVLSFRDSGPTQRKMMARPRVPPPPPPSGGPSPTETTPVPDTDGKPGNVDAEPRPRCVAPHIARRAFLYGDIESPTSEEFKPLDAAVEGISPPSKSSEPVQPDPSAYSPLSDFATLYIDDEDWRSYSEPVRLPLPGFGMVSSSFRARRSIGKTPKTVRFDPRALFLSAAADGELDVLKATASKVLEGDVSGETAMTAVKNAISAHRCDVIKLLAELGCDVNMTDSDGWTPLHFAACCNNVEMVRLLVSCGASVLMRTSDDHETAGQKCDRNLPGYEDCSEFLLETICKLGVANDGVVYTTCDYQAKNADELSFVKGRRLKVSRKGDGTESEWWWANVDGQQGYVPQNLLALYPPVFPATSEPSSSEQQNAT